MIRVHEINVDGNLNDYTAFNLDDMDQFGRYLDCLKVNRTTYGDFTEGDHRYALLDSADGKRCEVSIEASPSWRHANCDFCQLHFDQAAGNGTGRFA